MLKINYTFVRSLLFLFISFLLLSCNRSQSNDVNFPSTIKISSICLSYGIADKEKRKATVFKILLVTDRNKLSRLSKLINESYSKLLPSSVSGPYEVSFSYQGEGLAWNKKVECMIVGSPGEILAFSFKYKNKWVYIKDKYFSDNFLLILKEFEYCENLYFMRFPDPRNNLSSYEATF